ncbi:MBL fold metallo-hydrolase [Sporomusa sphaeroides]|uniref:MBL fold metallo-hydrolase n=1 Tax=Sporomusa sphaeroides TaxID=47679 RepID=UPI002C1588B1|nr:MBL fold metallo-hydrolase [Sporomusa sphaeroides]HML34904.1 MBL fold metallo-hydrolase [Sporomusa sphaeroides]
MKMQQLRNATIRIEYAGKNFLIDPWLRPKASMGPLIGYALVNPAVKDIKIPMCELPKATEEILADIDAYIVTHVHPDHFDMNPNGTGGDLLCKNTAIWVQNAKDAEYMKRSGFIDVRIMQETGCDIEGNIRLTKTPGCHGTKAPCGPASGFILQHKEEKTIYVAGDTIWYPEVKATLKTYQPDIVVLNACAAELLDFGRLIMDDNDVYEVYKACPNAAIIASHMDTVSHATLTRKTLRKKLAEKAIADKILIPVDGEIYQF